MIKTIPDLRSDGIVPFEPEIFDSFGINYFQKEKHNNHLDAGTQANIEVVYHKALK